MKKLMMAAAIVCAAVGVQAAQVVWSVSGGVYSTAEGAATTSLPAGSSLVLVVMTSSSDWANAVDVSGLTGVTKDTIALNSKAAKLGQTSGSLEFTYDSTGKLVNGNYLALMVKDSDGLHQLTYTTGDDAEGAMDAVWQISGVANNSSSVTGAAIAATGNFTAESIPEPTSGLLLLLGMAGLALRRKRA